MHINNSGSDDENEQNQQNDPNGQPMQGPRAASERDVREAEQKAVDAQERIDALRAEKSRLQERVDELEELVDELITHLDEDLEAIANGTQTPWKGVKRTKKLRERVDSPVSDSDGARALPVDVDMDG